MLSRITLRISLLIVTCFLGFGSAAGQLSFEQQAPGQSEDLLKTPRRAVHTFLHWQQEGHWHPERVIRTMQLYNGDTKQKITLAKQLANPGFSWVTDKI